MELVGRSHNEHRNDGYEGCKALQKPPRRRPYALDKRVSSYLQLNSSGQYLNLIDTGK